jgi:hypothetical protein
MTEICALAWLCHPLFLLSRIGALLTAVVPRTEGILPLQIKELVSAGKLFAMVRLDMNRPFRYQSCAAVALLNRVNSRWIMTLTVQNV